MPAGFPPAGGSSVTPCLHRSMRSRSCHLTDEDCDASWFSQDHSQLVAELGPQPRAGAALIVFIELLLCSKQHDQHLENKGGKGRPALGSLHLIKRDQRHWMLKRHVILLRLL